MRAWRPVNRISVIRTSCKMKLFAGVICLFLYLLLRAGAEDAEIQHLSTLLQTVSPNNETGNARIKEQIVDMFMKMDLAFVGDDTSLDNSKRILKRIEFCRKALIYIMDSIRGGEGDEECGQCVKEPDATKLTELFDGLGPEVWRRIDKATAELLVNATVSLKGLKDQSSISAYKKKLYCNAERMNLSSQETPEDNSVNVDALFTTITSSLQNVEPKNATANRLISTKVTDTLKDLDPVVCEDAFAPTDYGRTLKKVFLCKRALMFLRDSAKTIENSFVECGDGGFNSPDTRPLLFLLYNFSPEIAGKINDFIGRILVDVAVDLKCLKDGKQRDEFIKQLDFNINRLNLIW